MIILVIGTDSIGAAGKNAPLAVAQPGKVTFCHVKVSLCHITVWPQVQTLSVINDYQLITTMYLK